MAGKFYDHAKNSLPAAVGWAMAMARRDALAAGDAYRVEFLNSAGELHWWDGCWYDALGLAKSLLSNGYADVKLLRADGSLVDVAAASY